jgi:hypothetical protein
MNIQKKKKRLGINHIDYNAGNVEHNIAMFNKMNNPISAPSTNPVSGPMGESLKEGLINDEAKRILKCKEHESIEGKNINLIINIFKNWTNIGLF